MPVLTFGSLFAGIGGFDLGFERAGMRCVWQVEIDPYCRKVLAKHWPDVPKWDDVRTFTGEGFERPDVICGGFPCQDISVSGTGEGLDGKRSGLWSEYVRVIRVFRPRFVVVENVAALLKRGFGRVLGDLASLGFDAEWSVLSACAMGATHTRERLFVLAYSPGVVGFARNWNQQNRKGQISAVNRSTVAEIVLAETVYADGGNPDGFPRNVDGTRGLGNAVYPPAAEWIGRRLMEVS